jgi:hypothetical protein
MDMIYFKVKPPRPPRLSESDGGQGMNTNKRKYFPVNPVYPVQGFCFLDK